MKIEKIKIETKEEYRICYRKGFEPLLDPRFDIEIGLRIWIQNELFRAGTNGNRQKANQKFYTWILKNKPHVCEESLKTIHNASAINISHILTRGGFAELAYDPRNVNILSAEMHAVWENANGESLYTRKGMKIFSRNKTVINKLKKEYS